MNGKGDVDRYSYILKFLVGAAALLLILVLLNPASPKTEYDEKCYRDFCINLCNEMKYRFGRFDYDDWVRCVCLTNVTLTPIELYSIRGNLCPQLEKDRRCDESFCEKSCIKEHGFLPGHSSLRYRDGHYVCICRDVDVSWYAEAYKLEVEVCSS